MDKVLAIFILAHKNYIQVKRLISQLQHTSVDIYIHCDSRWDEGYVNLKKLESDSIFVVEKRYPTDLDTWNLIKAPMSLMYFSICKVNRRYKYYALLSGQDYPIISIKKIVSELELSYPKPFIDCTPYDKNNWVYHKFSSYRFFEKYSKFINSKIKYHIIRKLIKVPVFILEKCFMDKIYTPKTRLEKMGIQLYGGSAWWILPYDIMKYVHFEYTKNDDYIQILSKTLTPEETFFQIMTMRTDFYKYVNVNPKSMRLQNCKTYAHFYPAEKTYKGHPYVLTLENVELLKEKSHSFYFARKFDLEEDESVLNYIDKYLL